MGVKEAIGEVQLAEWHQLLESYRNGYRVSSRANQAEVGDTILSVIAEDSFIIGKVIKELFPFYTINIKYQLGETYHNDDNNCVCVNYWEIYEVLNAIS